jgi:hypothetical protein
MIGLEGRFFKRINFFCRGAVKDCYGGHGWAAELPWLSDLA